MVHLRNKIQDMTPISYIGLSISPVLALLLYFYLILINNKRFGWLLVKSFLLGALASGITILSIYLAKREEINISTDLLSTLIYTFLIVGFTGEVGKFLVLRLFILPDNKIKTPIHGLGLSVMTSLGFSTTFGLFFFFNLLNSNPPYAFNTFMLLVGPANVVFGIVLGFFLGLLKFVETRFIYNLAGLLSAGFFAGLFSFCMITHDYKLLSLFAFGSSTVVMVLVFRAISYRP